MAPTPIKSAALVRTFGLRFALIASGDSRIAPAELLRYWRSKRGADAKSLKTRSPERRLILKCPQSESVVRHDCPEGEKGGRLVRSGR